MRPQDATAWHADAAGRLHERALAQLQDLTARDADEHRDVGEAEDQDDVDQALADDRCDHDHEQDVRHREQQVVAPHDDPVEATTAIAGDQAEGHAEGGGDHHTADRDRQRHPRAVDQAAEDVATEAVGAEQERRRAVGRPERWCVGVAEALLQRVVWRDQRGEHREQDEREEHRRTEHPTRRAVERSELGEPPAGHRPPDHAVVDHLDRHRGVPNLMRGSASWYSTSASSENTIVISPPRNARPWTRGKSRLPTASASRPPAPGQENTASM